MHSAIRGRQMPRLYGWCQTAGAMALFRAAVVLPGDLEMRRADSRFNDLGTSLRRTFSVSVEM
jgi:hypothetical protein